jgi:hypothetical protein
MLLASGLVGIFRITQPRGGLWWYLAVRAESRMALELERERNRATARVLRLLPDGCELLEYEREGRCRFIGKRSLLGSPAAAEPELRGPGEVDR